MKKKNDTAFNRLNIVLASGLCVLSAKRREGSSIALLIVSDFTNSTRVVFDVEGKKLLTNRDGIDFTKSDIEVISAALTAEKK